MNRVRTLIGSVVLVMGTSALGDGAEVTVYLNTWQIDNAFELLFEASAADNDGIAGYNVELSDFDTIDHRHLGVGIPEVVLVNGFQLFASPPPGATSGAVFGGQNCDSCGRPFYHIGSPDELVPPPPTGMTNLNLPPIGSPFAPLLIARGTADWQNVRFGSSTNVNVWRDGAAAQMSFAAEAANVRLVVQRIPVAEPATSGLAAIVASGLVVLGMLKNMAPFRTVSAG